MYQFTMDHDEIALKSPELTPEIIYCIFGYIGESPIQKSIGNALQRLYGEQTITYYAITFSNDNRKLYMLSKKDASMSKDAKTKNEVEAGE